MSLKDLEKILEEYEASGETSDGLEIELRQAAQNLWRAQFLYRTDFGSKTSFDLILKHRAYFENLFEALGYRVVGGRMNDSYLGLLAIDLPPRQSMKLDESVLLLVLRLYYEEAYKKYEMNDAAEIEVDGETIINIYEERTRRPRPHVTRVYEILNSFRQRGLLRIEEREDRRNFTLFLRPALPIVVAEDTLASLDEYVARERDVTQEDNSGEQEGAPS